MATYIKGNSVANATSYELLEKKGANRIDVATPASAPNCWSYDASTQTWTATNSNSSNLRYEANLEAGDTVTFSVDVVINSGTFIMTIRTSANSIVATTTINKSGTWTATYTVTESGTYRFQTAGNQDTNSATYTNIKVLVDGDPEYRYESITEDDEINFDVATLNFGTGDHILVVKAKADGYEDSDYSNEVTYSA